jgi:hydroxymethylglutaryl-CoA lyase
MMPPLICSRGRRNRIWEGTMQTMIEQLWTANPTRQARVVEVGPRDGLQNSNIHLSIDERVRLVERLTSAGFRDVEVGSFVHPKWVPQMASTGEVVKRIHKLDGVRYWALVPNMRGLELALEAGVKHVAVFVSSSETHNQHNLNRSIAQSLKEISEVTAVCRREALAIRGYISAVFGCPFEGAIDFGKVMEIGGVLLEQGALEISLGDTTGEGQPFDVESKITRALEAWGPDRVALHLHDTRGVALVIATLALRLGVRSFDASVGGLGGCPYAPGAAGNLASEDLINLLDGLKIKHGIDLDALITIAEGLQREHHLSPSSRYLPFALSKRSSNRASPPDASPLQLACANPGR